MSTPRIASLNPSRTITGGRVTVVGHDLPVSAQSLPTVRVGASTARVVFASPREIAAVVDLPDGGQSAVEIPGVEGGCPLEVGVPVATGLHQVDSPMFDQAGNLYLTYSGTRGQQVPVSIFRVSPNGTRESLSSAITNPTSMALGPDGAVYVSSRFEGVVYRLGEDGSATVFASDLGVACGLAFGPDGSLYVGDRSGTIFAVDGAGRAAVLATLPASVAAFHLAMGADALYVTGPTLSARDVVYRVGLDGSVTDYCGSFGRPQGLAFDRSGRLFVVDALAGASGLYQVDPPAPPALVVSGPRLIGLAFDPHGGVVVCTADTAYRLPSI